MLLYIYSVFISNIMVVLKEKPDALNDGTHITTLTTHAVVSDGLDRQKVRPLGFMMNDDAV